MTRFWPDGLLVDVDIDDLWSPLCLTWQSASHPIERIHDRWRVDEDWWSGRIWREYFIVTTITGLLVEIFHDLLSRQWYLQRLYD